MTRTTCLAALIAALTLIATPSTRADLILGLSSTAPDLNNIHVGDTVTIAVALSELGGAGNPSALSNLSVDVAFDGTLLGTPTAFTAGAIVPDSTSPSFTTGGSSGTASAIYDNVISGTNPPAITSNGTFFTFSVVAAAPGSGSFTFSPAPGAIDDSNNAAAINGRALAFRVTSNAIPEPSSALLCALGIAGLASHRLVRRARARA